MNKLQKSYLDKFTFDSIYFEITSYCNANCSYCYNNSSEKGKHISFFNIIDVMKQAYQINPKIDIVFSGGEPLLHPNFIDIIKFAYENNSEITIITNAYLIKKMISYDVLKNCNIQVTIESVDEKEHDTIRGIQSYQNIVNLQNYIPNFYNKKRILRVNLTKYNMRYIEEFAEFAIKHQYTDLSFGFLVKQGRAKNNLNVIDFEEDRELCNKVIKTIKSISEKTNLNIERKNCYPRTGCQLIDKKNPSMALKIDANGYVFPCLYFNNIDHSLGNIINDPLRDILRGESFINLLNSLLYRESHINFCKKCIWEMQCFKGCPALAFSKHDTLNEKINCSFLKETFEEAIRSKCYKNKNIQY